MFNRIKANITHRLSEQVDHIGEHAFSKKLDENYQNYRDHVMQASDLHTKHGEKAKNQINNLLKKADEHEDVYNYDIGDKRQLGVRMMHNAMNKIYGRRTDGFPTLPPGTFGHSSDVRPKVKSKGVVDVPNKSDTGGVRIAKHLLNSYEEEFNSAYELITELKDETVKSYREKSQEDLNSRSKQMKNLKIGTKEYSDNLNKVVSRLQGTLDANKRIYKPEEKKTNEEYSINSDDRTSEFETHYESFQEAIEAAKMHALSAGYLHNDKEFESITNKGHIKPKQKKTHVFHMSLSDNHGNELNKIHSFQITGKGDGKFNLTQDIK